MKQLEPDLSRFNYFVHLLLQLNLLASTLFSSIHNLYLCPTDASLYHKPWNFAYAEVKQALYMSGSYLEHCLPQQDPKAHTPKCSASFPSGHAAFCNSCCWVCSDDGGCYKAVGGLFLGYLFLHVTHLLPSLSPQIAANYSLGYSSAGAGWLF